MPAKPQQKSERTSASPAAAHGLKIRPARIYVLVNTHMQHLVKIGKTRRTVDRRAKELARGTGVPEKFDILVDELVADADLVERRIHERLDVYRVNAGREFFKAPKPLVMRTTFAVCAEVNNEIAREVRGIRIEIQAQTDARKLKQLLSPHRGGDAFIVAHFHNGEVEVDVSLSKDWCVQVSVELISQLQDAFGEGHVFFIGQS